MLFDLVQDFGAVLDAIPAEHPRRRILTLLDEALRRDVHFINRHPTTLFQCLWNSCWWYDCPEAGPHYDLSAHGESIPMPWEQAARPLSRLIERWRATKDASVPFAAWLRSLRPPTMQLGSPQRMVLRGHHGGVNCVAFSPDGRFILSAGETIRVWDFDTGAELLRLREHENYVSMAVYSPDGTWIVSRSPDGTLREWDAQTGAQLFCLTERGWSACFSPDGRWIIGDAWPDSVRVWDAQTGAELRHLEGNESRPAGVACSPDGQRFLTTGLVDACVRIRDIHDGQELLRLTGNHAAYSPDGRRVVSAVNESSELSVRLWDADSGVELLRILTPGMVFSLAFSPDGRRIATGTPDAVLVWDALSGAELLRLAGHAREVSSLCFSPDGRYIASGAPDSTVRVWDTLWAGATLKLNRHEDEVRDVRFAPDGQRFITHSKDRTVRVWDTQTGLQLLCIQTDGVDTVGFSPDGQRIIGARVEIDKAIYAWDSWSGECLQTLRGKGGAKAIAPRGATDIPWVLRGQPGRNKFLSDYYRGTSELDTILESATTGEPLAWYPEPLEHVVAHPSGRRWAGHVGQDVCFLALEGVIEEGMPIPNGSQGS